MIEKLKEIHDKYGKLGVGLLQRKLKVRREFAIELIRMFEKIRKL